MAVKSSDRYVSHTEPEALIPNRITGFVWRTQPGIWTVICDYPKDNRKALAIVAELQQAVERRPKHRVFDRIGVGSWPRSL